MLADDEYIKYENGNPDKNNIFGQKNKILFKEYENIDGLNTSQFWRVNSDKIKTRVEEKIKKLNNNEEMTDEEKIELEELKRAEKAIDCFEFYCKIDRRIDCYIEMLGEEKYTKDERGILNSNNIFEQKNKILFKGYENIDGLNTSQFWSHNSINIISRLFYNTDDKGNKLENDYSGPEYDKARQAILEYAKVESIDEYIEKQKNEKKRNTLIKLRENASNLTISDVEKAGRIIRGILDKDKEIA